MMSKEYGVFVRESTGLVKSANLWDAVSINIANMSIGAALASIGFTLAALPTVAGANLVYASLIAALFALPQVIVYSTLIRYIPRVGGDYVWLGRALGPKLAWLTNGLVFGFIIESLTYYALIAFSSVFQLQAVLPILGVNISLSTIEEVGIGIAFFAVIVIVNILGTKYGVKLMTALTAISLLGLLAAIVVLFATPKAQIISAVSSLLPSGYTYSKVASSYTGPYFSMSTILMLLPFFAIYVYPWLNAGPAIASEIKGKNALHWNVPMAFLFSLIFLTLGFEAMYYSLGFNFVTAALSNYNINGILNFWTIAMVASHNAALSWFIGISSVTWYLAVLAYGAIVVVRYWFALAFDRVWPSVFAYVSPRFGTPIYAHTFDLVITAALIAAAGIIYNTFTALYGAVVEAVIYYMVVGVAAVIIATLKYSSFNVNSRSRVILGIFGALMFGVMAYITYEFLAYPQIWGGNWLAYGVELGAVILGIAVYLVSRYISLRRYGIDISVAYTEIPPE
ncbi:APC family permease [Vulcanisaeta souniana]|uniref:Amino acid permease n=2 Tax=Vulcanisaeta souniana JCM 11219 TaxID=1293586 RepID=A0ABM8BLY6_9CREN|nr:APC family permease [Vulcanisaeta souniana]BDR92025.1 amino acid permease [Vulcanisaeta souniana JCM 11219]